MGKKTVSVLSHSEDERGLIASPVLKQSSELTLEYIEGDMENLNPEFALYSSKNKCVRTDIFPLPHISRLY